MKKLTLLSLLFMCTILGAFDICYADWAEVLPKGVTRIDVNADLYFPIDQKYNSDGDAEDLAAMFNVNLSNLGIPFGGRTDISFELEHQEVEILLSHGLTDKLSLGLLVPYYWTKNKVKAEVVGNPVFSTEDIQNMLVYGYGYDPIEDWSNSGLADIEAGARYRYVNSDKWRLAFTGAVRFPTGDAVDPDSLTSIGHGEEAYGILLHSNNDYVGFENLILNATLRYEIILPHHQTVRVPYPGEILTMNKESIDIDPGDVLELEVSGKYNFANGIGLSLLYEYGMRFEDDCSGDLGFAYETLEQNSDAKSHIGTAEISYSTVKKYMEKEFPVPLQLSLSYRNRFAGENTLKSQYIGLSATLYW